MTANPLRAARGTTATLNTRVLKDGELAYNTTTEELHVGDGVMFGGRPVSGWQVLARSFAAIAHTGTLVETTLATVTVPAGAMGANGVLRITSIWSYPNNGNLKTLRIQFDGNNILNTAPTTTSQHQSIITLGNRNSASSQVMGSGATAATGGLGNTGTTPVTMAVNTAIVKDLTFKATLANTGDTITLEGYLIELSYGA